LLLLIVALMFGSIGGLVVAAILKLLDNIVKVRKTRSSPPLPKTEKIFGLD
jgi:hypothetical protein